MTFNKPTAEDIHRLLKKGPAENKDDIIFRLYYEDRAVRLDKEGILQFVHYYNYVDHEVRSLIFQEINKGKWFWDGKGVFEGLRIRQKDDEYYPWP